MSYLGLSFFGREDGALVVDDTPVNSARCAIELYTTTDGGASWSGPVVARKGTGVCLNNVAGAPPIAVGPNRFWIEEDDRLLTGRLEASNAGARFEALPSAGPLCSLGTDGAMLWAVSGSDCQASSGPTTVDHAGYEISAFLAAQVSTAPCHGLPLARRGARLTTWTRP